MTINGDSEAESGGNHDPCPMSNFCPLGRSVGDMVRELKAVARELKELKHETLKTLRHIMLCVVFMAIVFLFHDAVKNLHLRGLGMDISMDAKAAEAAQPK